MMQNNLNSPLYRVFVGVCFLAIGLLLNWLSENTDVIISVICENPAGTICAAVELAILDLGLKAVAYTLIVLGCVLIALYDFVANLLGSILSFALNHITNSKQVILDAMSNNRINQQESSEIIVETISRYKGFRDKNSESFAKYLHENLVEQNRHDSGFWRQNFSSVVDVKALENSDALPSSHYLKWIEASRYSVSNELENQVYKYSSFSLVEVDTPENLESIIRAFRYDVRIGGKIEFSFGEYRDSIDLEKLKAGEELKIGSCSVKFESGALSIWVEKPVNVLGFETDIVVDEESFIMMNDNVYELAFFEPTRGFSFRFNLPESFEVYHAGVSGTRFGTRASSDVVVTDDIGNRVRVDGASWALPGIVAVFVWKEG